MFVVARRDVNNEVALVGEVMAGKGAMEAQTRMRRGCLLSRGRSKQTLGRVGGRAGGRVSRGVFVRGV